MHPWGLNANTQPQNRKGKGEKKRNKRNKSSEKMLYVGVLERIIVFFFTLFQRIVYSSLFILAQLRL